MEKFTRQIDKEKMNQSKQRTMSYVMNEIEPYQVKQRSYFSFKKTSTIMASVFVIALIAIIPFLNNTPVDPPTPPIDVLGDYESQKVAEVGYIGGSLLTNSFELHNQHFYVSKNIIFDTLPLAEFEQNIDRFNIYFDMLKQYTDPSFIEQNITVNQIEGDYETEILFTDGDKTFRYLLTITEGDIEGILEVNGATYNVEGFIKEEDNEYKVNLKATNGVDYIQIDYKVEDEEELERKYIIKEYFGGVLNEKEINIEIAGDEASVELVENEDHYSLEMEIEDGNVYYQLEYEVNGVSGEAIITPIINQDGTTTYRYFIEEDGEELEIEKDDPDDD